MTHDPTRAAGASREASAPSPTYVLVLAWIAVGAPLLWGVAETLAKALALFR